MHGCSMQYADQECWCWLALDLRMLMDLRMKTGDQFKTNVMFKKVIINHCSPMPMRCSSRIMCRWWVMSVEYPQVLLTKNLVIVRQSRMIMKLCDANLKCLATWPTILLTNAGNVVISVGMIGSWDGDGFVCYFFYFYDASSNCIPPHLYSSSSVTTFKRLHFSVATSTSSISVSFASLLCLHLVYPLLLLNSTEEFFESSTANSFTSSAPSYYANSTLTKVKGPAWTTPMKFWGNSNL